MPSNIEQFAKVTDHWTVWYVLFYRLLIRTSLLSSRSAMSIVRICFCWLNIKVRFITFAALVHLKIFQSLYPSFPSPPFYYPSIRARVWVVVFHHCSCCTAFGMKVWSKTFSFIQKICVSISRHFLTIEGGHTQAKMKEIDYYRDQRGKSVECIKANFHWWSHKFKLVHTHTHAYTQIRIHTVVYKLQHIFSTVCSCSWTNMNVNTHAHSHIQILYTLY